MMHEIRIEMVKKTEQELAEERMAKRMKFVMFELMNGGKIAVKAGGIEYVCEYVNAERDERGTKIKMRGYYGREYILKDDFATVLSRINLAVEEDREVW